MACDDYGVGGEKTDVTGAARGHHIDALHLLIWGMHYLHNGVCVACMALYGWTYTAEVQLLENNTRRLYMLRRPISEECAAFRIIGFPFPSRDGSVATSSTMVNVTLAW